MIYFDNSATTKPDDSVVATYDKVSKEFWGNPSSLHSICWNNLEHKLLNY